MSTHPLLAAIWKRNLPVFRARLDQLDATAAAARVGCMTAAQRAEALVNAHTLAGSLGTFGYPEGTAIARILEQTLEAPGDPDPTTLGHLSASLRAATGL